MNRIVTFFSVGLLLVSCGNPSSNQTESTNVEQTAAQEPKGSEETSKWEYEESQDKMGDKESTAYLVSDDILEFEFPYEGGVESTLIIRKVSQGLNIMYKVSKGQIVSANPIDGGSVRVKFDDEAPASYGVVGASDHSSDVIFFNQEKKLLDKIKKSKKMVIEVEFFNEGIRQVVFDTQGLKWEK